MIKILVTLYSYHQHNIFGTYNFAFSGRNLLPSQTTSINVLGAITYRGDVTPITLTPAQLADPLPPELFTDSADKSLSSGLRYDLNTGQLIYVGAMSTDAYNFLINPSVLVLDKNGQPETKLLVGPDGKPILDNGNLQYVNVTKQLTLDATQKGMIDQLYNASQDATLGSQGLAVAGAGHFNVRANTMDLGVSAGITVQVPPVFATSVALSDPLPSVLFDPAQSGDPEVAGKLHYDSASGKLIFAGVMTSADVAFLLNPTKVVTDANGKSTTQPVTLDSVQLAAVSQLYTENKKYVMGATLNVTTLGDLSMTSTTIANQGLFGDINLNVGAYDPPDVPKGIFTTSGGNISVVANGDVNVNGSRIAAYNGGSVTVLSKTGDVNAGSGGAGYISVNSLQFDPHTGQLVLDASGQPQTISFSIAGSGILATTLYGSDATLGNILVEAPNGNISASKGGVIQVSFDATDASKATTELLSGYQLQDPNGHLVLAQNLANGTPVLALGDQNLVAFGAAISFVPSGGSTPVSLTPLLDSQGHPHLDANGRPLYIETSDATKSVVEVVNNTIQPFLDASGFPIKVTAPLDANNNPIQVLGRNIDAEGSGVIAQNIVAQATGKINGLFIGFTSVNLTANSYGKGLANGPTVSVDQTGDSGSGPGIQVVSDNPSVNGVSTAPSPSEAPSASQPVAENTDAANDVAKTSGASDDGDDSLGKKKGKGIGLAQKVSRVTVILPPKKLSEKATGNNPL